MNGYGRDQIFGGPGPERGVPRFGGFGYPGYVGYGDSKVNDPYAAGGGGGTWRGVGRWLSQNPETVIAGIGAGLGYYGARQQRKQEEEQFNRSFGLQQQDRALNERELQARLDADKAEQARRRRAIMQILAMDRERKPARGQAAVQIES